MKLKSATAIVVSSFSLLVASLAVAQNPPRQAPGVGGATARPVGQGIPGGNLTVPPRVQVNAQTPPTAQPTNPGGARPTAVPARPAGAPPPAAPAAPAAGPGSTTGAPGNPNPAPFEAGIEYHPMPPGARITFNLADADLPDLIRAIGNITGKRFLYSNKLRSIKATIYSPTRVTPAEAYQAFLSVLEVNGMTVIPAGRYLKIEETAGAATNSLPTYSHGESAPADDRFVTRIHRVRNMSAEDAATVLGHFKSRDGDITAYAATNTVIITDTGANIRRMMTILSEVDVPSVGEQMWVERIHHRTATEIAQRITEILGGGSGGSGGGGGAARPGGASGPNSRPARVLPDEHSNSVIVVATQAMYLRVLELIRRLDVPVEGDGELHVMYLQHADAEELAGTLNSVVGGGRGTRPGGGAAPAGGGGGGGSAAASGIFEGAVRITADKRTNALVITSSPRDYASVRRVITDLDRARRQVFIEAVVMEVSITNNTKLGVSWHGGVPGSVNSPNDTLFLGGFQAPQSIGFPTSLAANQDAVQAGALGVRGPIIPGSQGQLGISTGIPGFGAVITALSSSGDSDVLATPSIIATDNTQAIINVGQNIPLQTNLGGLSGVPGLGGATGNPLGALGLGGFGGGFSAPRQDVGTKITVTPHINDSNEIRLDIDEEISEAGDPQGALGAVPINKRNAKTTVVVQDQQTIVIGGLIRNAVRRGNTRIPILGDLPLIGVLFRTETRTVERRNLLLIMTPYVIRDQSDLRRIFERKMRERQEFLDRYFVFSEGTEYQPMIDYTRTNGLVEEMRQSIRDLRVQAEIEGRAVPRPPPPHTVSEPIELPAEMQGANRGTAGSTGPPPAGGGDAPGPAGRPPTAAPAPAPAPAPTPQAAPPMPQL